MTAGEIGTLFDAVLADTRVLRAEAYADSARAEVQVHVVGGGHMSFGAATFAEAVCAAARHYGILEPEAVT